MVQKEVSLTCVLAWVGWALAIISAGFSLAQPELHLASLVVLFAAAGAVLHIRTFMAGMEDRSRRAFELGRTYERGQVRQLR